MVNTSQNSTLKLVLAASMAVITAITAQLKFNLGPVPYTMQNFGIVLSGLLLGPVYGALAQLIYLAMIAIGLPVASGFRSGLEVLFGYTAGYLWMFPVAAFITGLVRRAVWKKGSKAELSILWLGSCIATIPVYLAGFYVFYSFATGGVLGEWCQSVVEYFGLSLSPYWTVFFASVAIFIPQDFFVDHVLAVLAFAYVFDLMRQKGIEI
ncbi:biotin transporter BioY [Archaeoglobus veneficus]|uniref:BioY protein n=1 Tax=Archaeoglobus veneficus (strain DSM 11195 / SNP6) TaxID=693661 RepID=F2KNQ8_ARCVS|nr:biotin transporter BioY [Archaeoglobus veneficus]AEA46286.1 BioY protein [Archaeoglobus veneficus SNP6]